MFVFLPSQNLFLASSSWLGLISVLLFAGRRGHGARVAPWVQHRRVVGSKLDGCGGVAEACSEWYGQWPVLGHLFQSGRVRSARSNVFH